MNNPLLERVRLIKGTPPCSPGFCVVCRNPGDQDSKFIDFGFDIDFYGVVYFCEHCICQVLTLLDYVPTNELRRVEGLLNDTQREHDRLVKIHRGVESVIESIRSLNLSSSSSNSNSEQLNVVDSVSEDSKSAKQSSAKPVTAKPGPVKSSNESRSTGVRNNDPAKKSASKFDI